MNIFALRRGGKNTIREKKKYLRYHRVLLKSLMGRVNAILKLSAIVSTWLFFHLAFFLHWGRSIQWLDWHERSSSLRREWCHPTRLVNLKFDVAVLQNFGKMYMRLFCLIKNTQQYDHGVGVDFVIAYKLLLSDTWISFRVTFNARIYTKWLRRGLWQLGRFKLRIFL